MGEVAGDTGGGADMTPEAAQIIGEAISEVAWVLALIALICGYVYWSTH